MFEFLTKEIGLDPKNLYITVFRGDEELKIPRDDESVAIWQELFKGVGINAKAVDFAEKNGMQGGRIFYYAVEKNWWSRSGVPKNMPLGEPGGPDSEMFWDFGAELQLHEKSEFKDQPCHVNCDCGRFLEIGNNVFMQYVKTENGFEFLKQKNVDFGGGFERILAAMNGNPDIFLTDLFSDILKKIEEVSGRKYDESEETRRSFRVIADHLKASVFLIGDGVTPSNTEQGYFVRRLVRRAIRYCHMLGVKENFTGKIAEVVVEMYKGFYPELEKDKNNILAELEKEENKFRKTLDKGLAELEKISKNGRISGKEAFDLFQTYGFPIELTREFVDGIDYKLTREEKIKISEDFDNELKKHQELSRTASAGMFKGGLADAGEITVKYHTATHLLLAALREVLGAETYQKGSNINAERLRFDFNYPEKLTPEQLKQVEDLVNQKIQENIPVEMTEMPKDEALKNVKVSFDPAKYGDIVKVYKVGDFSIELCGGPHVASTGELGHFKIKKEEASSAGVRRIKAILK